MKKINQLLENFDGETYDLCYKLLEENDNEAEVFEYVCRKDFVPPKEKTIPIEAYFSDSEITKYKSIFGDTVDGLINGVIKKCDYGLIEIKDFYKSLWEGYCANFSTKKEKAFAFYYTLIDSRIPYQYLGKPLSMDNDKYKALIDKNKLAIKKIEYILKSDFDQKTERASLVLRCLDEIEDYESKVVVLAFAFDIKSKRKSIRSIGDLDSFDIDSMIKQIDKYIEELEQ